MRVFEGDILFLGADAMLARAFRERVERGESPCREAQTRFLARAECDITSADSVERAIGPATTLVVNCAAYTNVDAAETDEAAATLVNGVGVGLLARRCAQVGATLAHFSTDYVFPGDASLPYAIDATRAPIGAYGRSKLAGERELERSAADWLCLRTSWLYAPWGKNFVLTIAKLAREKSSLRVVNDQRGRPTSCETLAWITERLLEHGSRGMRHATDGGECTWFEFASDIAARVNPACVVEPCSSAEFPRPARRPAYSVLDLAETEAVTGAIPHWRVALSRTLERAGHAP
ncbi:MAG: dTDP-4-dehydrorhamnose reductase [Phycisphaeraceae bacterium]|nr:dTDP-4-dehydrorhamnose reductase [Phycisphaeraceae bacterium]